MDLSHVVFMSESFVGSPQANEEYNTSAGKQPQIISYLKINVGSIGCLKLQKDKTSGLSGGKVWNNIAAPTWDQTIRTDKELCFQAVQSNEEGTPRTLSLCRVQYPALLTPVLLSSLQKASRSQLPEPGEGSFLSRPSHHRVNCKECFIRSTSEFNKLSSVAQPEEMVLCQSSLRGAIWLWHYHCLIKTYLASAS